MKGNFLSGVKGLAGCAMAMTSAVAFAAQAEAGDGLISKVLIYAVVLFLSFAVGFAIIAYIMKLRDKRGTPLSKVIAGHVAIESVGPDTLVTDCVRTMSAKKIGALLVLEGGKLAGIFTERDALNRVLAAGVDPRTTKVSDVMTANPITVEPSVTIGKAMELVTQRGFRHLPVVENGKLVSVISSRDLTQWVV